MDRTVWEGAELDLTVVPPDPQQEAEMLILPAGLKVVEEAAFAGSGVTVVIVPASVEHIEAYAFAGCMNLKRVVILGNDTVIEEHAFDNCPQLEE